MWYNQWILCSVLSTMGRFTDSRNQRLQHGTKHRQRVQNEVIRRRTTQPTNETVEQQERCINLKYYYWFTIRCYLYILTINFSTIYLTSFNFYIFYTAYMMFKINFLIIRRLRVQCWIVSSDCKSAYPNLI